MQRDTDWDRDILYTECQCLVIINKSSSICKAGDLLVLFVGSSGLTRILSSIYRAHYSYPAADVTEDEISMRCCSIFCSYWVLLCFCVSCLMMRIEKAATYTNYYQHRRVPRQICGEKTLIGTNPNEFAKGFSFLLNAGDSSLICCCMGHRWGIEE